MACGNMSVPTPDKRFTKDYVLLGGPLFSLFGTRKGSICLRMVRDRRAWSAVARDAVIA